MIKFLLILLCFTLAKCRFIYPHSYYYYGNYHNLRHFRRYYSLNEPPPYFDPFQNNEIREFQCPEEKFRCSYPLNYIETYIFQCYCDDDCPENYKCCPDSCFKHKVCKEIQRKRNTVIRTTTTPIQRTEIVTETEQITESEKITEDTITERSTEQTTTDKESTNAILVNENTTLTTSGVSTEKTVKRTETTTEEQPALETTQIIEASGSGDSAIDDDDDDDVTEAQVPAEIRLTATTTSEISRNSDNINFDDSTDNYLTISKEANTDDDEDIGDIGSGVEANEENLQQVPQINPKLHEEKEENNRSVSIEDLPKKHEVTEGNRKEENEADLDLDYNIGRKEGKIDDDDEVIGDIGSRTAVNEENLPQVPQIKHELHGEEVKNRSVSTEDLPKEDEEMEEKRKEDAEENEADLEDYVINRKEDHIDDDDEDEDIGVAVNEENLPQVPQIKHNSHEKEETKNRSVSTEDLVKEHKDTEGNRKEKDGENEADLEVYFLPDYESETNRNSDDKEFDDSTDNNRTILMNKIDETTINKVTDNSDKNKIDIITTQQPLEITSNDNRNRSESIIGQNDNVIKRKEEPNIDDDVEEDIGEIGSGITLEKVPQVPQMKHESHEEEAKNRPAVSTEDLPKEHDDDNEDIGEIGSGTVINEENLQQVPKHEFHGEEEAKILSLSTEDLPKEHGETEGNRKEDVDENEGDLKDYVINIKKDNFDDDDEDFGEISSGIAVNKENLPQVPQIKHELHEEEEREAKNRSVSTEDLPKEHEDDEADLEDHDVDQKEDKIDDDDDEDIGDIGSGVAVNEENLPQVPQVKHELHREEEEAKILSVSTKDLTKKREKAERNWKEDVEENEADLEDYFLPDYEILD